MSNKDKLDDVSLAMKILKPETSWEHQERAVYSIDKMEKEINERLTLKKDQLKDEESK